MRFSEALIPTLKELPKDAEIPSHRLMLRAGLVRQLTAGVYSYLPLGYRALLKVIAIVREEMDAAGGQEILMPVIHPIEIWNESGRNIDFGDTMFRLKDRSGREMALGPTHEEVVTDIARAYLSSYRQLPVNLYQIQTKLRDEPRPRFGVLRTKEFIMKDAYSFDATMEGLDESFGAMFEAYCRIFSRCGLEYTTVMAESGAMGGSDSIEFMVLTENGEDKVATCSECGYAANLERAELPRPEGETPAPEGEVEEIATPEKRTIEEVSEFLGTTADKLVKTLIYMAPDGRGGEEPVAAMVRGDHAINEMKLVRALDCGTGLRLAEPDEIEKATGAPVGFAGPVGLEGVRIVADYAIKLLGSFVAGANKADAHVKNVNPGRDCRIEGYYDLRTAEAGDPCPECAAEGKAGTYGIASAMEVGHIFKLGTKYSESMGAQFLDDKGEKHAVIMGCYGIGVTRILAAVIETNYDERGICWPSSVAPYTICVLPTNVTDEKIVDAAEKLYASLLLAGIDAIIDDRDARAGVKFADCDLAGFPVRITVGAKSLKNEAVEVKLRRAAKDDFEEVSIDEVVPRVREVLAEIGPVAGGELR